MSHAGYDRHSIDSDTSGCQCCGEHMCVCEAEAAEAEKSLFLGGSNWMAFPADLADMNYLGKVKALYNCRTDQLVGKVKVAASMLDMQIAGEVKGLESGFHR